MLKKKKIIINKNGENRSDLCCRNSSTAEQCLQNKMVNYRMKTYLTAGEKFSSRTTPCDNNILRK